ncbi:MAG: YeeE/YedE family protein [Candidatus Accumulibacter sp. UW26]|jgi:uncharacterized membrane protein YedE/YeeE
MMIDWTHFTPLAALAGGALIGVAVTLFALVNGRIAGISGIIGGLLRPRPGDVGWRLAFVLGLLLAPLFYRIFGSLPETSIETGPGLIILAGLLVGLGTRYGAGCTSGHGVCGLSRRSPRSMVATLAFMAAGFATVFVTRHLLT